MILQILGEIGESKWASTFTTSAMVKAKLKSAGNSPAVVFIDSHGGDAFEGIAIYNLLREHPGHVTVNVIGKAAAAACVIAMAGDTVNISDKAFMMICKSWGIVLGSQDDQREMANVLDAIDQATAGVYSARSGKPIAEILALMQKETWFSAAAAVKEGFADSIARLPASIRLDPDEPHCDFTP